MKIRISKSHMGIRSIARIGATGALSFYSCIGLQGEPRPSIADVSTSRATASPHRSLMGCLCSLFVRQSGAVVLALLLVCSFSKLGRTDEPEPIRVGVLHSLTGTMAISEAPLERLLQMLIEDQNAAGGLLRRPLEMVSVDAASTEVGYEAGARELILQNGVDVIFGCWTSACRKVVLPLVEKYNVLLFYPVQYEGQESSRNIFYFGATPNQQAIPAVDYLMDESGDAVLRWFLVGTDYIYPHITNTILHAYLKYRGVSDGDIRVVYTPFGHSDWGPIVDEIRSFSEIGLRTAIVSTVNGDANLYFFRELSSKGIDPDVIPIMSFSVSDQEIQALTENFEGYLSSWNYFMSVDTERNKTFIDRWRVYTNDPQAVTSDPMEAHLIGFRMWSQAVLQSGVVDADAVRQAMYGQRVVSLSGDIIEMQGNHHVSKSVFIGRVSADGQFEIVWSSGGVVTPDAWSDFLPGSAGLTADWRYPWVCGGCEFPTFSSPED